MQSIDQSIYLPKEQVYYKFSLTNFQEISRTHLTKFQLDFYIDRASEVLEHGIQTHALSVMYDMNKTAQKWSNDSFSGLKT